MKTLVIRPGTCQMPGEFIRKKAKVDEHPSYKLARSTTLWKYFFGVSLIKAPGPIAVVNKLLQLGFDVDALEMTDLGVAVTREGKEIQNQRFIDIIRKGKYDLICISCTSCSEYLATQQIANTCKKTLPHSHVLAGGYHASADAVDMMESIPDIDVIVISDFEGLADTLLSALKNKTDLAFIPNLVYRKNGKIVTTKREYIRITFEDHIPPLRKSPFDNYFYLYSLHGIEASRGCSYNRCKFCVEPLMRNYYILKPVSRVIDEMEHTIDTAFKNNYPDNMKISFYFCDPLWGGRNSWIKEFCDQLKIQKKRFKLPFNWTVDMRIDQKAHDLFPLMCEQGCSGISFGMESFNKNTLINMDKTKNFEKYFTCAKETIRAAAHALDKVNGAVTVSLIFGWPGDQMKDILYTFDKLAKLKKDIGKNIDITRLAAIPFPGTHLWDIMYNEELKNKHDASVVFSKRFWKEGYLPGSPIINASRTLSAAALSSYGTGLLQDTEIVGEDRDSEWLNDKSFEKRILTQDIIEKEDIMTYAEMIRRNNTNRGPYKLLSGKRKI